MIRRFIDMGTKVPEWFVPASALAFGPFLMAFTIITIFTATGVLGVLFALASTILTAIMLTLVVAAVLADRREVRAWDEAQRRDRLENAKAIMAEEIK